MIFKIFRTEWKRNLLPCICGLALCIAAAAVCGIVGLFGEDAFAARAAEVGFAIFNAMSYAVPLLLVVVALVCAAGRYYRLAGIKENTAAYGALFGAFAWAAMFILAEILLATAFDFLCFIGRDTVRAQVGWNSFLLSLRAHGVLRLVFAPSVGASAALLFIICDVVRLTAVRTRTAGGKIAAVFAAAGLIAAYQIILLHFSFVFNSLCDASLFPVPDSVLPLHWLGSFMHSAPDTVKDTHWLSAPLLNAVWLAGECAFCMLVYGYTTLLRRCKNEIESN